MVRIIISCRSRVVSFSPGIRNELDESRVNTAPISLVNCQIKDTIPISICSQDNRFEITNTISLPDDFKPLQGSSPDLKLDDLNAMPVDQNVTIAIKILNEPPSNIYNYSWEGTYVTYYWWVLWGKDIDRFNEGNSYKLEGIGIHCYHGNMHFALSDEVGSLN